MLCYVVLCYITICYSTICLTLLHFIQFQCHGIMVLASCAQLGVQNQAPCTALSLGVSGTGVNMLGSKQTL